MHTQNLKNNVFYNYIITLTKHFCTTKRERNKLRPLGSNCYFIIMLSQSGNGV